MHLTKDITWVKWANLLGSNGARMRSFVCLFPIEDVGILQ